MNRRMTTGCLNRNGTTLNPGIRGARSGLSVVVCGVGGRSAQDGRSFRETDSGFAGPCAAHCALFSQWSRRPNMSAHDIVHVEIPSANTAVNAKFYGDAFGWKLEH